MMWTTAAGLAVRLIVPFMAIAQAPPALTAVRDLRIDAATADFSRAGSMLISRTGEMLVIDDQDNIFRTFNASGPTGTIGRVGEGPGEFKNLRSAGWLGDSIWVYDPNLKRFSIFGPDHKFVRAFRTPTTVIAPAATADSTPVEIYPQALLPDGNLRILVAYPPSRRPSWASGVDSGYSLLLRTTPTGLLRNRVMVVSPPRCGVDFPMGAGRSGRAYIQFCAEGVATEWVQTPTGIIVRADVEPAGGKGTSYQLTATNESGAVLFKRSYPFAPVPVPKSALDSSNAYREKLYERAGPVYAAFARKLAPATTFPPVRRIVSGRDGTIWLEERVPRAGHFWRILDQKGAVVGTLTLPDDISMQAADMQAVWGYETDADGLQGIVRYRLTRPRN